MDQIHNSDWLRIQRKGESLETISMGILDASLLASGDGTEIIHHRLPGGTYWQLFPDESGTPFEYLHILTGKLHCSVQSGVSILEPGDCLTAHPTRSVTHFYAEVDTEFIYVSSRCVFSDYGKQLIQLRNLAIDIEQKDGYTAEHCNRILYLSLDLGRALSLTTHEIFNLQWGSLLHDVGKVRIPESILNKPGKFSPQEWETMKQHAVYGRDMLVESGLHFLIEASVIVEQHHERFDGSGYPHGLSGENIHIGAAIIAVVDSFDAMTTDRVYKKAKSRDTALRELYDGRGSLYHPDVVDQFLLLNHFPGASG